MRKHVIHFFLVAILTIFCANGLQAQTVVNGMVIDAESNEPLVGATILEKGTAKGAVADVDGKFEITVAPGATLIFRSLGYKDIARTIAGSASIDLGTIALEIDAIGLADVTITSSIAIDRKTPVAMATVTPQIIDERLGVKEFPEILKLTPGVHVTRDGGAFGDAKVNLRGFKSENVAVMVNGVPMNDMEWGGVYWSNWAGLADVTRYMQVQRGLGSSKVSSPSVGGSINIVTRTIDAKKGGFASYTMGTDGYNKLLFSVSTGLSKTGWALTLMGGKTWGDGYVQGTEFESYNYFLSIAKMINDSHQISFTGFGAPQVHNQRGSYDGLTIKGWQQMQQYMPNGDLYRYNATYGFGKNGERITSAKNKYHKPQLSLNHMWQIDMKSSLSTALYMSIGDGWGLRGEGSDSSMANGWYGVSNGVLNTKYRNADGTFAYDQIQEMNENSTNGSQMILALNKNQHRWYGLLSTYERELNENLNISGGIDARYYKGMHTAEISDLMNGAYYVDARNRSNVLPENNSAAKNTSFLKEKLTVGDVVYRDYDSHIIQSGLFGQAEYTLGGLSAFASASVNESTQWRYDRFYYDENHAKSGTVTNWGFNIKGGANYNLNDYHNIFMNIGYISRAPQFNGGVFLQSTTSNVINKDALNEKIFSVELGYGVRTSFLSANLNLYHTNWNDKTMARMGDFSDKTDRYTVNMQGVDAIHQGLEIDLAAHPFTWLDITGSFSMGNWRWNGTATGYFYNSAGQPITTDYKVASGVGASDHAKSTFKMDGVKVGGSAQTSLSAGIKIKPTKDISFGADWFFTDRNYADWTPINNDLKLGGETTYEKPWKIPSAHVFDLYASYSFQLGGLSSSVSGNISNLFNQEYIESAYDGSSHSWTSATRVFYGLGREMSVKFRVNF
ncbi:outer membrane cobalamin receptor [Parabacteroides sp. PFB2-12]|uniref:TonB-dependent receptor n=1 Tax=unclassified Parabacteroides TaxID=2649774 RepID=UPI00247626B7|nr:MULTISPECIES: carboxypeptidase-like regulatory domain-containing protein [unclassified Parabacteroides]MDH6344142.1 outer membrane cobalamin receptor [Parabacteroides sp. PM6-13]MDH6392033.1 outer membrane cobalamin receptor [Parabacteroides sp. PFB2-12]